MPIPNTNFYIYLHNDPETNENVYIGHGNNSRAWLIGPTFRSEEHQKWLENLLNTGYDLSEIVTIGHKGLTKQQAREHELYLIHKWKPRFNKSIRYSGLKFTPEKYDKAKILREQGLSYNKIAKELELAPMTVHRGMSGKSISLETALAER